MCIIVDVNMAESILLKGDAQLAGPVFTWLLKRGGRVVTGGKLARELAGNRRILPVLAELRRAGRLRVENEARVDAEELSVSETGLCRSNDAHVVALARVSGARTLCTNDHALMADFRRATLIDRPRGSIYSRPGQGRLLRHSPTCGLP